MQISFYSQWIGCQQSCFAYHSKCLRFAQVLATHMRSFFLPRCSSRVSIFTRHWHMPGPWKPTWVAQQLASKVCGGFEFWKQFGVRRMGSDLGNPPKNRREEFFEMVEDTSEIYQWDFDPSLATWRGLVCRTWYRSWFALSQQEGSYDPFNISTTSWIETASWFDPALP